MKKLTSAVATLCCLTTITSVTACDGGGSPPVTGKVDIWSKEGHVKVLRDETYDESYRNPLAVNIGVCKNEYEGTQIILTANGADVEEYDLEICDLKTADGETFSKENIAVYNEKYIEVYAVDYDNTLGLDWYPDALLPFETAVEYDENKVEAGKNQGIYIEAYAPKDAKPGVYKGDFKLTVDGVKHNVPAEITVYDYSISEYNHLGSIFSYHFDGRGTAGEMNSSEELQTKYLETMLEFRMSVPVDSGTIPEWVANFRKYCDPKQTPASSAMGTIRIQTEQKGSGINQEKFRERLVAIAAACIVDGEDYLALTDTRCGFIDEPHHKDTHPLVNSVCKSFNEARDTFAEDLLSGAAISAIQTAVQSVVGVTMSDEEFLRVYSEMKDQMYESARGIVNMVTTYFDTRLTEDVQSYCTTRGGAQTAKAREVYKDMEYDQWWYTCTAGTGNMRYGIDTQLLDPRLAAWASFDYGFCGDIHWESLLYTDKTNDPLAGTRVEYAVDCYQEANRDSMSPGDGFLFYPGKPYGIFGPVSCLRTHAIRDGHEEYEMFYDLEQKYTAKGYSPRAILGVLFKDLYGDTTLTANADDVFAGARKTLIELCILAEKGVFVTDYTEIGAQANITVRCDGETNLAKLNGETKEAQDVYNATCSLAGDNNEFTLELTDGMKFNMSLGNKQNVVKTFTATNDMSVVTGAALSVNTIDGVSGVKVDMLPLDYGESTVQIALDKTTLTKNTTSFSIRVYNPNAKKTYMSAFLKGSNGVAMVGDAVVYPGWNTLQYNKLSTTKWSLVRVLEGLQLSFSVGTGENVTDYEGLTVSYMIVEE